MCIRESNYRRYRSSSPKGQLSVLSFHSSIVQVYLYLSKVNAWIVPGRL